MKKKVRSVRSAIAGSRVAGQKINSIVVNPLPGYLDCQKCLAGSGVIFEEKLKSYALLTSEKMVVAMSNDRHEMMMRNSVFLQDQIGVLDKLIAFEKEKIEKEKERVEKKRLTKEANQKTIDGRLISKIGELKLVLDCEEGELAGFFKNAILMGRNSKTNLIFNGTHKELARWMCDSISLRNGNELSFNTINNALSQK